MRRGILVAGNYTHDLRRSANDRRELGGAAAYASAVLRAAGVDFAVVAKVGSDFLYPDRAPPALVVPGTSTTTFVYDDRTGERTAALLCAAPALAPEDLRETCEVGMAVAVAGEIPVPTLLKLRELSRVLLADAQGFVRAFDLSGRILHVPPAPELLAALEHVDYLKASRAEAEALDLSRLRRSCTILLTDGARGCTLLSAADEIHVPAFPAREIDPTGAGDCFLAGFAVGLLRGNSPREAARLGAWCGARCTESPGIPSLNDLPDLG